MDYKVIKEVQHGKRKESEKKDRNFTQTWVAISKGILICINI